MLNLAVIDFETGCLNPAEGEILSMAIVPLDEGLNPIEEQIFYEKVRPDIEPQKGALIVNKLWKWKEHQSKPEFKEKYLAWKKQFKKKHVLIAQHAPFEVMWCYRTFGWKGYGDLASRQKIKCTRSLAEDIDVMLELHGRPTFFNGKYSLKNLCECLRADNKGAHDALSDALATAEVYKKEIELLGELING